MHISSLAIGQLFCCLTCILLEVLNQGCLHCLNMKFGKARGEISCVKYFNGESYGKWATRKIGRNCEVDECGCRLALYVRKFRVYCLRIIKRLKYKAQINGDKRLRRPFVLFNYILQ
jgi:hypothetical protein